MKLVSLFVLLCWVPVVLGSEVYVSAKDIRENASRNSLKLRSHIALVYDEREDDVILARHATDIVPVASLSKLITAMVILDADLDMNEAITISREDRDRIRYSRSRLKRGMTFTRQDLLMITLAASENRAAAALARTYPGGTEVFVKAMNGKAEELGLKNSRFVDAAGLGNGNVSTAEELLQMVKAAGEYPVIRQYTTQTKHSIREIKRGHVIEFGNTNRLVHRKAWPISLSKTGFTGDAGNCLVMQTEINDRPVIMVLLNSWGKLSKYGDSNRIKAWLTKAERKVIRRKAQKIASTTLSQN